MDQVTLAMTLTLIFGALFSGALPLLPIPPAMAQEPEEPKETQGPGKILSVRSVLSEIVIIPPGSTGSTFVNCSSDEVITGGGFEISPFSAKNSVGQDSFDPTASVPQWLVTMRNEDTRDITLQVRVMCTKLVPSP